ncbi:hypothetical protein [Allofournierella sp.]|uniref:hypothetical protein n=1 Tax=Allofournierella sp. TaxID=1940256 RepID=UPI003AB11A4D
MLKSARFLSRSMLNNLGILFVFEGGCAAGVLLLKDSDNIFGTYLGACTMMTLIIVMVMCSNWTQSLVQVGLAMSGTRRGMWGAIELNLLAAAAGGLALQAVVDRVIAAQGTRFAMNLPAQGFTLPLLAALLLLVGNLGALTGMLKVTWMKVVFIIVMMLAVVGGMLLGMAREFAWFRPGLQGPVLGAAAGASLVLAAGCAAWLHKKLRTAQVLVM